MASNEIKSELESFREQWRAEVRSKVPSSKNEPSQQQAVAGPSNTQRRASHHEIAQPKSKPPKPVKASEASGKQPPAAAGKKTEQHDSDEEEYVTTSFDEPAPAPPSSLPGQGESEAGRGEPVSALEHFEQAVEREAAGNLGDSLRLYRKAYRVSSPPSTVTLSHLH